jgi:hypothetical protein
MSKAYARPSPPASHTVVPSRANALHSAKGMDTLVDNNGGGSAMENVGTGALLLGA